MVEKVFTGEEYGGLSARFVQLKYVISAGEDARQKNYGFQKFRSKNFNTARLTSIKQVRIEETTIFLQYSSTSHTPFESSQLV